MDINNMVTKLQKENEDMKNQILNLQNSINIYKRKLTNSKSKEPKMNNLTLNDFNSSTNEDIYSIKDFEQQRIKTPNKIKNGLKFNKINYEKAKKKKKDFDINYYKYILDYNDKLYIEKTKRLNEIHKFHNLSSTREDLDSKKNLIQNQVIKRAIKGKKIIDQISYLKENYIGYNNSYNKIFGKTNKANGSISKKNLQLNNLSHTREKNKIEGLKTEECKNDKSKRKITVHKIRTNSVVRTQKSNGGKYRYDNLRTSYDKFSIKRKMAEVAIKKNKEILIYLKEINNLQNVIRTLKKENNQLKDSLYREKKNNQKFKKITREFIRYYENNKD